MSEKLCTLRTKGGGGGQKYTETSLWTNPSPNSNFAQTTVTLSDSMSNYKYLAFAFKGVTSSTTVVRAVVSVEDLGKMGITSNTPDIRLNGTASANGYSRYVIKASDTTITFGSAYATNTQASDNSRAIPVEILGLNELDHGKKFDETTLWTNSAPTSSFAAQNVTLSDNLSNYDYFKIKFRLSTTQDTSAMVMDSVSDFLTNYSNSSSTWRGTMFYTTSTVHLIRRFRNNNNGSEIRFMATMTCTISDHTWTDSSGNLTYLIPTEIIGCKFR